MRLIIAGSRGIDTPADYERLRALLFTLPKPDEIVSGGARGPDKMGERLAAEFGIPVRQFIPKWQNPDGTTNKGAGFIRNGDMAVYASEAPGGTLVALWDGQSNGTRQMIEVAKTYALAVHILAPAAGIAKVEAPAPYIFPQSHSSLGVFETCPRQYEAKYITKEVKFVQGAAAAWGDKAHMALEAYMLSNRAQPLPPEMAHYQRWGDWVLDRAAQSGGQLIVERKSAVTKDKRPTEYGDRKGYIRGKIDVTIVYPSARLAEVFDWKTNDKIKNDATQLKLYNGFALTDYDVDCVRSGYVWLKHENVSPPVMSTRADLAAIWGEFDHKYDRLADAYARGVFPPRPNGLCKAYCDVLSCPHNGKGR